MANNQNPIFALANQLFQNNPNVANNPLGKACMDAIMNNDAKKGEELARNFCQTNGVSPEEGYNMAKNFFKF